MSTSEDVPGGPIDPDVVAARNLLNLVAPGATPTPTAQQMTEAIGRALVLLNRAIDTPAA